MTNKFTESLKEKITSLDNATLEEMWGLEKVGISYEFLPSLDNATLEEMCGLEKVGISYEFYYDLKGGKMKLVNYIQVFNPEARTDEYFKAQMGIPLEDADVKSHRIYFEVRNPKSCEHPFSEEDSGLLITYLNLVAFRINKVLKKRLHFVGFYARKTEHRLELGHII